MSRFSDLRGKKAKKTTKTVLKDGKPSKHPIDVPSSASSVKETRKQPQLTVETIQKVNEDHQIAKKELNLVTPIEVLEKKRKIIPEKKKQKPKIKRTKKESRPTIPIDQTTLSFEETTIESSLPLDDYRTDLTDKEIKNALMELKSFQDPRLYQLVLAVCHRYPIALNTISKQTGYRTGPPRTFLAAMRSKKVQKMNRFHVAIRALTVGRQVDGVWVCSPRTHQQSKRTIVIGRELYSQQAILARMRTLKSLERKILAFIMANQPISDSLSDWRGFETQEAISMATIRRTRTNLVRLGILTRRPLDGKQFFLVFDPSSISAFLEKENLE